MCSIRKIKFTALHTEQTIKRSYIQFLQQDRTNPKHLPGFFNEHYMMHPTRYKVCLNKVKPYSILDTCPGKHNTQAAYLDDNYVASVMVLTCRMRKA